MSIHLRNLNNWAQKYDLITEIKILIENGFDNLQSVAAITDSDLDTIGISKIGTKKKILAACTEVHRKAQKILQTGGSLADINNIAYTEERPKMLVPQPEPERADPSPITSPSPTTPSPTTPSPVPLRTVELFCNKFEIPIADEFSLDTMTGAEHKMKRAKKFLLRFKGNPKYCLSICPHDGDLIITVADANPSQLWHIYGDNNRFVVMNSKNHKYLYFSEDDKKMRPPSLHPSIAGNMTWSAMQVADNGFVIRPFTDKLPMPEILDGTGHYLTVGDGAKINLTSCIIDGYEVKTYPYMAVDMQSWDAVPY